MEEEAGGVVGDEDNRFNLQILGLVEHLRYKYYPRMTTNCPFYASPETPKHPFL